MTKREEIFTIIGADRTIQAADPTIRTKFVTWLDESTDLPKLRKSNILERLHYWGRFKRSLSAKDRELMVNHGKRLKR